MSPSRALLVVLCALQATAAWASRRSEPGDLLGLPWGAPVEAVKEEFPGGQLEQETSFTTTYSSFTHLEGIPLSATFQFVPEQGLQGILLRFPVHHLAEIVGMFEGRYGLAPMRANNQWRWEGSSVKISVGAYPSLTTGGSRGIAWLRTATLEGAMARGGGAPRPPSTAGAAAGGVGGPSGARYEERLLKKIYWALRYPATTQGVYLVSLTFRLTPAGRPTAVELSVEPPNPQVAESVLGAVTRAQPYPLPPAGGDGGDPLVSLTLTVTVMP